MLNRLFEVKNMQTKTGYICRLKVIFAERSITKKITQGEFAKKIGIGESTLSGIMNNHQLPQFDIAYRICQELGLPIHEIWKKCEE